MLDNPFDELKNNRNQILFIELAGLLHDIGKLSQKFLHYRKTWQGDKDGWDKDPHEHEYLDKHEVKVFKKLIPKEFTHKISEIASSNGYDFGEKDFSIRKAVHDHHKDKNKYKIGNITKMLQAADGKDAAIDRNNPMFSAEQKDTIYRSNVFGFEDRIVDDKNQEDVREKLYMYLNTELAGYLKKFDGTIRRRVLDNIEKAFRHGLSDTTRPQNDTSLWEHSYAVASILKVVTVHNSINKKETKIYNFKDIKFGIFGVGWDGLKFISYGQKIGDIVSRKNILDEIKKFVKKIIESEYPVGNTIYEDNNGIYFIVPVHFDKSPYANIRTYLLKRIYKDAAAESSGEFQPYIVDISETNTLTSIVRAIKEMREKTSRPFDSSEEGFEYFKKYLQKFESEKTICPICRLRSVEKEDIDKKICKECKERRIEAAALKRTIDDRRQTVFIDEIVDNNRGAALIVARFDLRDWLDGTMIRSLFVSEPKGIQKEIESLGEIKAFQVDIEKELRKKFKTTEYDYNCIKKDIDSFNPNSIDKERAKKTAFLYAYGNRGNKTEDYKVNVSNIWRNWQDLLDDARREIDDSSKDDILLYNILNAKSPTPSTILDVWLTTLHFFEKQVSEIFLDELGDFFPQVNRLRIKTKEELVFLRKGSLEAEIVYKTGAREKVEILLKDTRHLEVIGELYRSDDLKNTDVVRVNIVDKSYQASGDNNKVFSVEQCIPGDRYVGYRVITETPNIYMAIVPANRALELTKSIYSKYREQFGKVIGRLPFSIGNIFFRSKIPMFVVLDSGKRMLANFERLANSEKKVVFDVIGREEKNAQHSLNIEAVKGRGNEAYKRRVQWDLPSKLGNEDEDYYHPYFFVDSKNKGMTTRPTYFRTAAGNVVHFARIQDGDTLCLQPNFYDFEFLDSNIRRHKIGIDKNLRRGSSVADFTSRPFFLDELDQKIMRTWKDLIRGGQLSGITDAKLRNLQSLWLTKYQEWGISLDTPDTDDFQRWIELIEASIGKEFPKITEQTRDILLETIKNGVFFDMMELYLSILKMKIQA